MVECWNIGLSIIGMYHFFILKKDLTPISRPIIPVFQSSNIPEHKMLPNQQLA